MRLLEFTSILVAGFEAVGRMGSRLLGVRRRWLETQRGRLNLLEVEGRGDLPPIVLFHGLASCALDYGPLFPRLSRHARHLFALDMPGHGQSPVPEGGMDPDALEEAILEALDQVVDEPVILVGNSMGGLAALRYARARPERVLGLVLASPGGAPMTAEALDGLLDVFRIRTLRKARAFVERFAAHPNWLVRHVVAWGVRYRTRSKGVSDLVSRIDSELLLTPDELEDLDMPMLIVWGAEDGLLPSEHVEFFETHLPHAAIEKPEGMGHSPFFDRPRAFAKRILRFARELEESS